MINEISLVALFVALSTTYMLYKNDKDKQEIKNSYQDRLEILQDEFILKSRKLVFPILTDPKRTIRLVLKDDEKHKKIISHLTSNSEGIALFEHYLDDNYNFDCYISLDTEEININHFDKYFTIKVNAKEDKVIEYCKKSLKDKNVNCIVRNTKMDIFDDSINLALFFKNDKINLTDNIKEFIEFSVADYELYIKLLRDTKYLSSIIDIYYNNEKVAYFGENFKIHWFKD